MNEREAIVAWLRDEATLLRRSADRSAAARNFAHAADCESCAAYAESAATVFERGLHLKGNSDDR